MSLNQLLGGTGRKPYLDLTVNQVRTDRTLHPGEERFTQNVAGNVEVSYDKRTSVIIANVPGVTISLPLPPLSEVNEWLGMEKIILNIANQDVTSTASDLNMFPTFTNVTLNQGIIPSTLCLRFALNPLDPTDLSQARWGLFMNQECTFS